MSETGRPDVGRPLRDLPDPAPEPVADGSFEAKVRHLRLAARRERLRGEAERRLSVRQDRLARRVFAGRVYRLVASWLAFVAATLTAAGVCRVVRGGDFELPPASVLLALLGTTSVTVVGLFLAVLKYLFPPEAEQA